MWKMGNISFSYTFHILRSHRQQLQLLLSQLHWMQLKSRYLEWKKIKINVRLLFTILHEFCYHLPIPASSSWSMEIFPFTFSTLIFKTEYFVQRKINFKKYTPDCMRCDTDDCCGQLNIDFRLINKTDFQERQYSYVSIRLHSHIYIHHVPIISNIHRKII